MFLVIIVLALPMVAGKETFASKMYGMYNITDTVPFNTTLIYLTHGPITKITLYKAWYYDGAWHNPGELKGIRLEYGRDNTVLVGAEKPHNPFQFSLKPGEYIYAMEIGWDSVIRYIIFKTSHNTLYAWGFLNAKYKSLLQGPPLTKLVGLYGREGKPLPAYKKRYIASIGAIFAN